MDLSLLVETIIITLLSFSLDLFKYYGVKINDLTLNQG